MSQDRFQLATVERLRVSQRDEARRALGEALRAVAVLEGQQQAMQQELVRVGESRRPQAGEEVDPGRLLAAGRYDLVLRSRVQAIAENLQKLEAEIDARRTRLADAEREVRALAKLRERIAARRQLEQARREQREIDELAGRRHTNQSQDEPLLPLR